MKLFDLHCDTPFELYKKQTELEDNQLHISLKKAEIYTKYAQIMAIWTQHSLENEQAWAQFHAIYKDFLSKIPFEKAALCLSAEDFRNAEKAGKRQFFLAVEGASLLSGKAERLRELYALGVRFLTLVWRDADLIGGAFNTDMPLTPFGREVVEICFSLGITVDLSHASDAVTEECLALSEKAGRPVIATHSNSRAVCAHPRNLSDDAAKKIAACGGLIGVSMAPQHLDAPGEANVQSVCRHILHYLELGIGEHLALGCDFDGIDKTPAGVRNLSQLPRIAEALLKIGIPPTTVQAIFYENAAKFISNNL